MDWKTVVTYQDGTTETLYSTTRAEARACAQKFGAWPEVTNVTISKVGE